MNKDIMSKALVLGVIFLFIGVGIQPVLAVETKTIIEDNEFDSKLEKHIREEEIKNTNQYNGKADLECIAIGYKHGPGYSVSFRLHVLNKGNATLPGDRDNYVKLFMKPRYKQEIVHEDSYQWGDPWGAPHSPLTIDHWYKVSVPSPSISGEYRCFFEVAPHQQWDEWNYSNNKVWAYFLIPQFGTPRQLSELKFWKTGNEGSSTAIKSDVSDTQVKSAVNPCNCEVVDDVNLERVEKLVNRVKIFSKFIFILSKGDIKLSEKYERLSNDFITYKEMNKELKSNLPYNYNYFICFTLDIIYYSTLFYLYHLKELQKTYKDNPIILRIINSIHNSVSNYNQKIWDLYFYYDCI